MSDSDGVQIVSDCDQIEDIVSNLIDQEIADDVKVIDDCNKVEETFCSIETDTQAADDVHKGEEKHPLKVVLKRIHHNKNDQNSKVNVNSWDNHSK